MKRIKQHKGVTRQWTRKYLRDCNTRKAKTAYSPSINHIAPIAPIALCFLLAALFTISPRTAQANEGILLLGNDPLQLGRASSGVASPRSAAWALMNPAAIVDLERRLDLSLQLLRPNVIFTPQGLGANTRDGTPRFKGTFAIPSGGIIWPLERGTLALYSTVRSADAINFDHARNILSRLFQANRDRRLDYQHMRLVLAYAYQFDNGWALGATLQPSFNRLRTDHVTSRLRPTKGDFDWDDAFGIGFSVGLYKRWEKFAIGATYLSRHRTQSFHQFDDLLQERIDMPPALQLGIAYRPIPKLEFTLDYKYIAWRKVPLFKKFPNQGGFNWNNQHILKAGIEWKVSPRVTFTTGISHGNTPIDSSSVFASALLPATTETHAALGISYAHNAHHSIHLTYVREFPHTLTDTGQGRGVDRLGRNTRLKLEMHTLTLGYTYAF